MMISGSLILNMSSRAAITVTNVLSENRFFFTISADLSPVIIIGPMPMIQNTILNTNTEQEA